MAPIQKTVPDVPGIYVKHQQGGKENIRKIECHPKLVPATDFSTTDLPQCYQHDEMVKLVTSLAKITVKVEVTGVSEEWTKFWADKKCTSSMSQIGPLVSTDNLMGTGKVDDVFIRTEEDGPNPCSCEKCKTEPGKEWGEIKILTTAQLLYDDKDAQRFSAMFFFDSGNQSGGSLKVQGSMIVSRSVEKDLCMFKCVTCDVDLVRKLEGLLDSFEESWENAFDKYAHTVKWKEEKLVVIVSHPYGQKKHISLGKKMTEAKENRITYDNPTYPGAAGAYVLIPDFDVHDDILPFLH